MQGTGSERADSYCTFGCCNPFARLRLLQSAGVWQRLEILSNISPLLQASPGADFYFFDRLVLGGNHSADCQSTASQIDPISFYFADDDLWGYLSCAPAEVPPPAFVWFKTLDSSDHVKND